MNGMKKERFKRRVKWLLPFYLFTFLPLTVSAQRLLTLDSCRAMALRNNKQMSVSKVKQDVATNIRKSARTKYLPHVSALGTYQYTSRQVELLSDDQKTTLNNLGTSTVADFQNDLVSSEPMQNIAALLGAMGMNLDMFHQLTGKGLQNVAAKLNGLGANSTAWVQTWWTPSTRIPVISLRALSCWCSRCSWAGA